MNQISTVHRKVNLTPVVAEPEVFWPFQRVQRSGGEGRRVMLGSSARAVVVGGGQSRVVDRNGYMDFGAGLQNWTGIVLAANSNF